MVTVGQDDLFSYGPGLLVLPWRLWGKMIYSPVDKMISSPVEAFYPCSLGLMGSTSHLINEQGNGVREHSSTIDGRIDLSILLPMLG